MYIFLSFILLINSTFPGESLENHVGINMTVLSLHWTGSCESASCRLRSDRTKDGVVRQKGNFLNSEMSNRRGTKFVSTVLLFYFWIPSLFLVYVKVGTMFPYFILYHTLIPLVLRLLVDRIVLLDGSVLKIIFRLNRMKIISANLNRFFRSRRTFLVLRNKDRYIKVDFVILLNQYKFIHQQL